MLLKHHRRVIIVKSPTAQSENAGELQSLGEGKQDLAVTCLSFKEKGCQSFKKRNSMRMLLHTSGSDYTAQIDEGKVNGIRKAKEKVLIHRKIFILKYIYYAKFSASTNV